MRIAIEISGGFASIPALSRPITIDTTAIDPQLGRQLEALVQEATFFERPTVIETMAPGAADYQTYVITVQDGARSHTVRLTDPIADLSLDRLVSQLRATVRPSKP